MDDQKDQEEQLSAADLVRAQKWSEFIGQERAKAELRVRIDSALARDAPLPHTLLIAAPGAGKTTLARIIGGEMGETVLSFEMPFRNEDFRRLREGGRILHLDEIHRGSTSQKEDLLSLLEHHFIRFKSRGTLRWNSGLTVIGTTTEPGKLPRTLRDRFLSQPFFDEYTDEEMALIGRGMAQKLGIEASIEDCMVLARAAAGVPRRLSHFMVASRDLQISLDHNPSALEVLDFVRCDLDGLSPYHVNYLQQLERMSPLGLKPLSELLDLDETAVKELERLLLKLELIERTSRGRELSLEGFRKLKSLGAT